MWGPPQLMIPPYGAPYAAFYAHGGVYAHPGVHIICLMKSGTWLFLRLRSGDYMMNYQEDPWALRVLVVGVMNSCLKSVLPSMFEAAKILLNLVCENEPCTESTQAFAPIWKSLPNDFTKRGSPFPKAPSLLNNFEETLAARLTKLKPADKEDVLGLSWMISAMVALCEVHTDINTLITALELPVSDWEDKWIDVYLANSVKLLDICISFSSEVARLKQGHLYLQCVLHNLSSASSNQFVRARSSLDGWSKHIASKNPKLDNCFSVMDSLVQMLDEPKVKNSSKGKALMRAMYGVKVVTLFICSSFAAAFSGSPKKLIDLPVPESYLWAAEFMTIQAFINTEIKSIYSSKSFTILKELEAVDMRAKKLYPIVQDGVPTY